MICSKCEGTGEVPDQNQIELENKDVIVRIDGKLFRCECGGNVFRHPIGDLNRYSCNSCGTMYIGE